MPLRFKLENFYDMNNDRVVGPAQMIYPLALTVKSIVRNNVNYNGNNEPPVQLQY
jgi:hypothetical protein